MIGQSWVINLSRRRDRRERFEKIYNQLGPNLSLNFITAVDGTNVKEFERREIQHLLPLVSNTNDYDDNPRIRATILSHLMVWDKVANSTDGYGLICEDDIFFKELDKDSIEPPFKHYWPRMVANFPPKFKNGNAIIYFGTGDFLPIHTNPPTQHLLKSQERSHVTKIESRYFGHPNFKSAYVFGWLGGFSYILSKETAKNLLEFAKEHPIEVAVDSWLKNIVKSNQIEMTHYLTVPLLSYHPNYDFNMFDSDTFGISKPIDDKINYTDISETTNSSDYNKKYSISFLIPTRKRVKTLKQVLDSILINASGCLKIQFIIHSDKDDYKTKEFIKDNRQKYNIIGFDDGEIVGRRYLHTLYNKLCKLALNSTFIAIWDDDTIITTSNWDRKLCKQYEVLGIGDAKEPDLQMMSSMDNAIACFQLYQHEKSIWEFNCPILTSNFIRQLGGYISKCASVLEYLKFVSYLSRVNVFVKDIVIQNIDSEVHEYNRDQIKEIFRTNLTVKYDIEKDCAKLMSSPNYRACGLWIKKPKEWDTRKMIGNMAEELIMTRNDK